MLLLSGRSVVSDSLRPHGLQHARLPCPSPSPRACSSPCPLSQWCHPTLSSSVVPFSFCLQSSLILIFIYFLLAVLRLQCHVGPLQMWRAGATRAVVFRLLIAVASLVEEHRLPGCEGFSSCDSLTQLPWGVWDPPRPGVKPVSLALHDGPLTTKPPGSLRMDFCIILQLMG